MNVILYNICVVLILIGAINWGLVSLFKFDLVAAIFAGGSEFGKISTLSRVIYGLVGLAAIYVGCVYFLLF